MATSRINKRSTLKKSQKNSIFSRILSSRKALFMLSFAIVGIVGTTLIRANSLTPPASDSEKMIGINGTYNVDGYVADAQNLNAKWMRVETWGDNATYDTMPNTLNRLSAQNIRLFPLVNNYQTSFVTETGKQIWIDKAVYTAKTYGKGGTFWQGRTDLGSPVIELGNEVYGQWIPWPDQGYQHPEEYARLADRVATAVSTATNGRVSVIISVTGDYLNVADKTGGSSGTWHSWSRDMQTAVPDLQSKIGGVATHPYGDIASIGIGTSTDPNFSHQVLQTVHSLWSKPVYETEVGQKVPNITQDQQAAAMNYYFDELKNFPWLAGMFYYNQKDYQPYDSNGDNGWALIDYQDRRTLAWSVFQKRAGEFLPVATPDTTVPTGSITTPTSGSTVSGVTTLSADATDNTGVAGVQFMIDGVQVGVEDTTAPYTTSWDSLTVTNAGHEVSAKVRDTAGNINQTAPASVTVNNVVAPDTAAPTVPTSLTIIKKSSTTASFSWVASTDTGGSGLAGYRVYRNGTLVGSSTLTSFNDTGLTPTKFYSYTVVAYDKAGNSSKASTALKVRTSR